MKMTKLMWDMPITVNIADPECSVENFDGIFNYFAHVDAVFSTFRDDSEISRIRNGLVSSGKISPEMQEVLEWCYKTRRDTNGYFEVNYNGKPDPLGLVKGWAVHNAAEQLLQKGHRNFYIDAGGDTEVKGTKPDGGLWRIGIRNPFNREEIVKVIALRDCGIATSGSYVRGNHIVNPKTRETVSDIVSLSVVGPDVFKADRFATAAFAMGKQGIDFIAGIPDLEGYVIDTQGNATFTDGFTRFIV